MSLIKIPIFDGGLVTNADPEDIPNVAATESKNFELDVPGKLVKRTGRGSATTMSGDHPGQMLKWVNPKLANAVWVYYETQAHKIRTCAANFGTNTDIKALTHTNDYPVPDIQIQNFGHILRFANGLYNKPGIYQNIDREYFFGGYDPAAGLVYDDAPPSYPTTWTYGTITDETNSNGTHAAGFYYYKFVPVFDGIQEAPFGETYAHKEITGSNKGINIPISFDTSNWNKRITSIKVYRSYSPTATGDLDPVYYHIKTIPINTKITHEDNVSYTASYIGNVVYQKDFNFSAFEPSGSTHYWIKVGSDWYHIADSLGSNTNVAIVDKYYSAGSLETFAGFADGDEIWDDSWEIYEGTATAVTDYESAQPVSGGVGNDGYAGRNVIFKDSWDWAPLQKNDWTATVGSQTKKIVATTTKAVKVDSQFTDYTSNGTATLNDGYYYNVSGNDVTLTVSDFGVADGSLHRLNALDKVEVNYKYSVYISGRNFVGNVRLDPDGDAEDHEDWIIYSEIQQPDILPIVNYIQIKDTQGGAITGLTKHLGDLIVFMEKGVYRLDVPTVNPGQFILMEAEENHGCVAPNSIVTVGPDTFFAGIDNAYMIDAGFNVKAITEPIKDVYQAATNIANSRFIHDPKKNRLLCRFGDDKVNIYALDLNLNAWYQLDMGTSPAELFTIDESLDMYSITHLT